MKHALYRSRGPVPQDVIEAVEFPEPSLAPGQVLIEVLASPINPSDVLTLTGAYGVLPPLPAVGGNEGVGRVAAHGPEVTTPALGQLVMLPAGSGTWSTHMVGDAKRLIALPDADVQQMSMMTVNPPSAYLMLSDFVELAPGDWVIQNASNSGVGSYVNQIAKLRDIRIVNVVRRESAVAAVHDVGADVVIVDADDLHKQVAQATGGAKIKLALDAVGGGATERLVRCLTPGGTLVNYGALSGESCVVSPASFVFRDITLRGFWLVKWYRRSTPEQQRTVFGALMKMLMSGQLHARVDATYSIDNIKDAVKAAAAGERNGKILLTPNS